MSIKALMLYGSCARGDNDNTSDVDLLALQTADYYKMNAFSKLNVVFYSENLLRERVANGNLFCLHLVKEGKIISDSENLLSEILGKFEYKRTYEDEITEAANLAWVLIKFANEFDNYLYLNRKIVWAIRTIIIAKSAEARNPVFSKNDLMKFSQNKNVGKIVGLKKSKSFNNKVIKLIPNTLKDLGCSKPSWVNKVSSLQETADYFQEDSYPGQVISKSTSSYSFS